MNIRAICLHSSKGDTESTEFEIQEEQNASTRIRHYSPAALEITCSPRGDKRVALTMVPSYVRIEDQRRIHWLTSGVAAV